MKIRIYAGACLAAIALTGCGQSGSQQDTKPAVLQLGPPLSKATEQPALLDDYHCGDDGKSVEICHIPPGNPNARHTLCVGRPAVDAHLREHERDSIGDYLGKCGQDTDDCDEVGDDDSGSSSGAGDMDDQHGNSGAKSDGHGHNGHSNNGHHKTCTSSGGGSTDPGTGTTDPGTGTADPGTGGGTTDPGTGTTDPGTGSGTAGSDVPVCDVNCNL